MDKWGDEEGKRGEEEEHFIAHPDDSSDDLQVGGGKSSDGKPREYNSNYSSIPIPLPAVSQHSLQSSSQYPESEISKPKSGFSRTRTTRTRGAEYDDLDSWYVSGGRIDEDSNGGLSDDEPPSPYARLSDFRKPRATTSGQELPDYEQDDPAQSLLPTSVDRQGVSRRRVTPIHMRGHGRTNSDIVVQDVLRVPDRPLEGKLLPFSPASVYPEDEAPSLQKETLSLSHSANKLPPWSPGYRSFETPHARALSPPPSQLVSSDLSFSDPPRLSTVRSDDSLDLNLVLEDERGSPVLLTRSRKVNKDLPASVSSSSNFVNPPSRVARMPELDSQQVFSKVDDILRQSWDQRDVGNWPSSPTGFGAIIDDRSDVQRPLYGARPMKSGDGTGTGLVNFGTAREQDESIEQRLANLRRKDKRFDRM